MEIGLILPQGFFNEFEGWPADRAWQRILAIAHLAESLGFDSLWTGERVLARLGGTSPAFDFFTLWTRTDAHVPHRDSLLRRDQHQSSSVRNSACARPIERALQGNRPRPGNPQSCDSILPSWPYGGLKSTGGQRMARQEDLTSAGMMTNLATLPSRTEELVTWRDLGAARMMCGIPGLANTDETMYEFVEDCRTAGIDL